MPMIGFESESFSVKSNCSENCDTTTAPNGRVFTDVSIERLDAQAKSSQNIFTFTWCSQGVDFLIEIALFAIEI